MTAKQAVVVIHGIGEQVPMETLRALIDGLGFEDYSSRPDRLSGNSELRRIVLPAKHGSHPRTDFYELYWAHLMHRGRGYGTLFWALNLIFKRRGWWRTPIAPAMGLLAILTILGVAGMIGLVYLLLTRTNFFSQSVTVMILLVLVVAIYLFVRLSYLISNYIADAARYLTPRPANIEARAEIRKQGVELLRRLHESGEYQRVVVIGHSLGSVIGYDILRSYWDEARMPDLHRAGKQDEARAWQKTIDDLSNCPTRQQVDLFRQAQHRLWREQRARGVPWLVTDFITLGSPLAHASLILTTKKSTVEQATRDRELPVCPPRGDKNQKNHPGFYREDFPLAGGSYEKRTFLVADPGAVFACTRWANLYFPVHHMFRGDLVGGPVAPVFGAGVQDIAVRRTLRSKWKSCWREQFPFPHLSYWLSSEENQMSKLNRRRKNRESGSRESIPTLKHVIDLETEQANEDYPAPEPKRGSCLS